MAADVAAPMQWRQKGCAAVATAGAAVLQRWQPRVHARLHCSNGGKWGCATREAADGAALQVWQPVGLAAFVAAYGALPYWQPRVLRYRYGSQSSCVAIAAEALHCRRDRKGGPGCCAAGLSVERHCKSGSQWVCLISVAAYGGVVMSVMWWHPMRLRCRCGTWGLR